VKTRKTTEKKQSRKGKSTSSEGARNSRKVAKKTAIPTASPAATSAGGLPLEGCEGFEEFRDIVRQPVLQGLWPGETALVFVDGRLRLIDEAGYADVEKKIPMASSSLVRLYSMTKCVVAAAVLQLVDDGLLCLDDELADYLPCFQAPKVLIEKKDGWPEEGRTEPARREITLRHLLTHTSGISGGAAPGIDAIRRWNRRERAWIDVYKPLVKEVDAGQHTLKTFVEELALLPLWNHPGEHYSYGYSYDVLGYIIESKTGKDLATYLKEHIFEPLDMTSTGFDLTSMAASNPSLREEKKSSASRGGASQFRRLSVLYRRTKSSRYGADGKTSKLARIDPVGIGDESKWTKVGIPSAGGCVSSFAGGLLSTADDYAKFLLAVVSGGAHPSSGKRILSEEMAAEMLADQTAKLGSQVATACPYGDRALGLSCLGEVQRAGAPSTGGWFDGVQGVRLWGGAANTAFKFDRNNGKPILILIMSQVVPQDSGTTATALLRAVRAATQSVGAEQS